MAVPRGEVRSRLEKVVIVTEVVAEAGSRMASEQLVVHESTDSATAWVEIGQNTKVLTDKMNLTEKRVNDEIAQAMTGSLVWNGNSRGSRKLGVLRR